MRIHVLCSIALTSFFTVFALLGCLNNTQMIAIIDDSDGGTNDPLMPWGTYAATLDVPDCPASPYEPLVVNTTADELDGGNGITDPSQTGSHLSFIEAMWIAYNRSGPDTIYFDQAVFPVDVPGTIHINGDNSFPLNSEETCIDGRNHGVVIDWTEETMSLPKIWNLYLGSLQVGITLLRIPYEITVSDSQIAGCRLGTDGHSAFRSGRTRILELSNGAMIGPGNVIFTSFDAMRINWSSDSSSLITNNFIGYDPITHFNISVRTAFKLCGIVVIEHNVIAAHTNLINTCFSPSPIPEETITIRGNFVGVNAAGQVFSEQQQLAGITYLDAGKFLVEGNTIRSVGTAVLIDEDATAHITRNSITGNNAGISYLGIAPVDPPTITAVSASHVEGTCPKEGMIEVFSDPANQGETFLGSISCDGVTSWSLNVYVPNHRNVTATLTDTAGHTSTFSSPVPHQ